MWRSVTSTNVCSGDLPNERAASSDAEVAYLGFNSILETRSYL
jgi:hypothetical protein